MRLLVSFCLLLALLIYPPSALASGDGYPVRYDGGSLAGLKSGTKAILRIDGDHIVIAIKNSPVATIPASSVSEISYGQDVHRRVGAAIGMAIVSFGIGALMALTKSKKHYIGLTWADGTSKGGIAIQVDKNDYRGILAGLEGITGKKAVDTDAMNVKN